jgi:hypothetical protein
MPRALIVTDLEGVHGADCVEALVGGTAAWEHSRLRATHEVNLVITGLARQGFTEFAPQDGGEDLRVNKVIGGYNGGEFKSILEEAISIFDRDRFIPYKPRVVLVDGNIEESVPRFIEQNPGLRISLLHVDCDLYRPTRTALEALWPRVVTGGVVVFDDYGVRPWEGESAAADEYFMEKNIVLRRLDWAHSPGAYVVKGER